MLLAETTFNDVLIAVAASMFPAVGLSVAAYFTYRSTVAPKLNRIDENVNGRLDAALTAIAEHREVLQHAGIDPPPVPAKVDPALQPPGMLTPPRD